MNAILIELQNVFSDFSAWGPKALRILLIVVGSWLLWRFLRMVIRRTVESAVERNASAAQRLQTLRTVLRSAVGMSIFAIALTMVLGELGVNLGPILAAAGVVGVAFGFGAQSLVKDLLNGFFFLLEGQVHVGDIVQAGSNAGVVEGMSLRTLTLRDFEGNVHIIPHGEIAAITNMTKGYSRTVVEVGVAYRENGDEVMSILMEEAKSLQQDPDLGGEIIQDPEVFGIDAFNDSDVLFKVRFTTKPASQWNIARAFRRRIKARFDRDGIEIPFPHRTVYWGEDKQGQAPPLRMVWPDKEAYGPPPAPVSPEAGDSSKNAGGTAS